MELELCTLTPNTRRWANLDYFSPYLQSTTSAPPPFPFISKGVTDPATIREVFGGGGAKERRGEERREGTQ